MGGIFGTSNKMAEQTLGFDKYPERRSNVSKPVWYEKLINDSAGSLYYKNKCEARVVYEFQRNPILKLLSEALKNAGCPLDLKRHIVCENCGEDVQGGYDSEFNQIVLCKNVAAVRDNPVTVLYHELIHMYDYCVNETDFTDLKHLACTEIRAANLVHCSFLASLVGGQTKFNDIKKSQQYCVKMRAAYSLKVARNVDLRTAVNIVLDVFDKCYNDLEPVGRRLRRNSMDPTMAYEESRCFGIS